MRRLQAFIKGGSTTEFESFQSRLIFLDELGRSWALGVTSLSWNRAEEGTWMPDNPPNTLRIEAKTLSAVEAFLAKNDLTRADRLTQDSSATAEVPGDRTTGEATASPIAGTSPTTSDRAKIASQSDARDLIQRADNQLAWLGLIMITFLGLYGLNGANPNIAVFALLFSAFCWYLFLTKS